MKTIFSVFALVLLWVNLAGLTALLGRHLPSHAIARAAGILGIVSLLFFIEHFVGLGRLNWAWPFTTACSLVLLIRRRETLLGQGFLRAEAVFLAGFAYALFWRMSFPSIVPSSERITDLYFIQCYMAGERLPPLDLWFPSLRFDFYYALQHYGAALLGRVFDLPPGLSYNLAFCVLMALPITLAWDFASRFLQGPFARALVVVTLAIGGTGPTPFLELIHEPAPDTPRVVEVNERIWGSARFVGSFDQKVNTPLGQALFAPAAANLPPGFKARELPSENYGYQFALGDYHPPAGGFFLLLFALALIGALELQRASKDTRILTVLLGFSVSMQLATNTWVFPLQALLVLFWALWRQVSSWRPALAGSTASLPESGPRQPPDWLALIGGGLLGGALLYPFLTGLVQQPTASQLYWVKTADHTPWPQFLAALWPVLLFTGLGLFRREGPRIAVALALASLAILLLSEFIFVDDPSGDHFQRTNTTMKWWGYLNTLNIAGLASVLLACNAPWVRALVVATCLLLNLYSYDLARYWFHTPKHEFAQLYGDGAYKRDPPTREMLRFLEAAPQGIVMESLACGAFCDSGIHALFAGKPLLLGWPLHLQTWRVNAGGIWILKNEIDSFYRGELARPVQWLAAHDVRYIVWARSDAGNQSAWQAIDAAIANRYGWREFGRVGNAPVGIWVKSEAP